MFGHIPGFINNNIKQIKHVFDKSEILRQKLQKELNVFIKKGSELLGDILVTIILQAELQGVNLEECLEGAYNIINKRKGSMINGFFVKQN